MDKEAVNPPDCAVVVMAYPDGRVRPEIVHYLHDNGFPRHNVRYVVHMAHDRSAGANHAVHLLLSTGKPWVMFIESDVRPGPHTKLDSPYDVTCARCQTESPGSFADPTDFHSQMWWAKRDDLAKIKPPWFTWPEYKPGQVRGSDCYCSVFRGRAIAAGLSIGWSGFVGHTPAKERACEDFICRTPKHQC